MSQIDSILRVKLSIWLKNILQLLGILDRILVPPVTQLFKSQWFHFICECMLFEGIASTEQRHQVHARPHPAVAARTLAAQHAPGGAHRQRVRHLPRGNRGAHRHLLPVLPQQAGAQQAEGPPAGPGLSQHLPKLLGDPRQLEQHQQRQQLRQLRRPPAEAGVHCVLRGGDMQ